MRPSVVVPGAFRRSIRPRHLWLAAAACLALLVLAVAGALIYRQRTDPVLRTMTLGMRPMDIAVDDRSGHVFVAGLTATDPIPVVVDVLDVRTGDLLYSTPLTSGAEAYYTTMAFAPRADRLYVVVVVPDAGLDAVCALEPVMHFSATIATDR